MTFLLWWFLIWAVLKLWLRDLRKEEEKERKREQEEELRRKLDIPEDTKIVDVKAE